MGFMERFAPSVFLGIAAGTFAWIAGKVLEAVGITPPNTAEALFVVVSTAVVGIGLVQDVKEGKVNEQEETTTTTR